MQSPICVFPLLLALCTVSVAGTGSLTKAPLTAADRLSASASTQREASDSNRQAVAEQLKRQAIAWDLALVAKQRGAVLANMGEDFLHIGSNGQLSDRSAFIESIFSPNLTMQPYDMEDLQVRLFGDTAILTGTTTMQGRWKGKPFASHYRFSDTYVLRDGKWKVVHIQITDLPEP